MKNATQEEKVISMMKQPIPKKRVGIIKLKMIRDGTAVYGTERFHEAKEAVDMVRPLFEYSDREMMMVMSLDSAMTPIALEIVAVGGLSSCGIDPRDLIKHAILSNASKNFAFTIILLESRSQVERILLLQVGLRKPEYCWESNCLTIL